jgi:CheY-like chemotaxis protein
LSAPNLLLVDDNDDVREITALLLRDTGYSVIEASSGITALAALAANPAIELLIVDFSMPGMSGLELLERARAKRPEIKAVFITGYVDHTWLNGKPADETVVKSLSRWPSSRPRCARRWANPRSEPLGRDPAHSARSGRLAMVTT